jgi:hypothetical protein
MTHDVLGPVRVLFGVLFGFGGVGISTRACVSGRVGNPSEGLLSLVGLAGVLSRLCVEKAVSIRLRRGPRSDSRSLPTAGLGFGGVGLSSLL